MGNALDPGVLYILIVVIALCLVIKFKANIKAHVNSSLLQHQGRVCLC